MWWHRRGTTWSYPKPSCSPARIESSCASTPPIRASGTAVTRFHDSQDQTDYLYTLLVPADASSLFPCFDQPDLKARFELAVTAPSDWRVIGNAPELAITSNGEMATTRFAATEPISTYLFAFAAGPFAELKDQASGARLFVRRSRLERARQEADEVFRLTRQSEAYFADYFAQPFPFAKYDLVLIPELAYGGMEHAGATFLREDSVLFPFQPAAADRLRRAQLIFHETAHQWFGDLVTMRWFDDLWLKEGFANFMAAKATAALLPEFDAWNAFRALKTAAYRTDATRGTTPIWQSLPNLAGAKSAYGNIVYSKAPAVLRQAEFFLGEEVFRSAVREFTARHAFRAADWSDLVGAFEHSSGRNLQEWADAWVKRRGLPAVRVTWGVDAEGRLSQVALAAAGCARRGRSVADARAARRGRCRRQDRATASRAGGRVGARAVPRRAARAAVRFRERRGFRLRAVPARREEPCLRCWKESAACATRFCARCCGMRCGRACARPSCRRSTTSRWRCGSCRRSAMRSRCRASSPGYRLLSAGTCPTGSKRRSRHTLESALRAGMLGAPQTGLRIICFRAFAAVAASGEGRADLERLLSGQQVIPGVTLSSNDRFRVIRRLLTLNDAAGERWLAAQSQADRTDDGLRQAYAAGAARPDAATKRDYFDAFMSNPHLAERWIEDSLPPFNAVEQEALTLAFLEPALRALPELKRRHKIFFVNDWLAAFVGGQRSARALSTVEKFLAQPGLEPDLRLKLLEAVDGLERTVKIRARYSN